MVAPAHPRTRSGAAIFCEAERRAAPPLALRFDRDGACRETPPPSLAPLPRTRWRVDRATRSDAEARIKTIFEDAPF